MYYIESRNCNISKLFEILSSVANVHIEGDDLCGHMSYAPGLILNQINFEPNYLRLLGNVFEVVASAGAGDLGCAMNPAQKKTVVMRFAMTCEHVSCLITLEVVL